MLHSDVFWCIYRVMNGINAPKVVECLGSDGCRYRQLAKSGNDDLRQDAVRVSTRCLYVGWVCVRVPANAYLFVYIICLAI